MNLYKVELWLDINDFKAHLIIAKTNEDAISKAFEKEGCEELIGFTVKHIDEIDGYKIVVK